MRIFYTPTPTNRTFAAHAGRDERLRTHEFIPLAEGKAERIAELRSIEGRAAFIWGDGHSHDESYHFSLGKANHKVHVDQHEDNLDFRGEVDFSNHMAAWEKAAPASIYTIHGYRSLRNSISVGGISRLLEKGDLALSVDCDCISRFPAMPYWTLTQMKGFSVEDVVFFTSYLASSTSRFDIGGLPEGVGDFNFSQGLTQGV